MLQIYFFEKNHYLPCNFRKLLKCVGHFICCAYLVLFPFSVNSTQLVGLLGVVVLFWVSNQDGLLQNINLIIPGHQGTHMILSNSYVWY